MADWKSRIVGLNKYTVSDLLAHPYNARRHPPSQREALRGSLDALGIVAPPIHNVKTGHLLDGHARIEEYLTRNDDMLVDVLDVDLEEHEEALFLASFDFITSMATYDRDALDTLLKEVQTDDTRLQAMLSEMAEANDLYFGDKPTPAEDAGAQTDRAEELQKIWNVQRGDVWRIGKHRLMCGDSTSAEDVARLMDGVKATIVVNDPPYGMRLDADFSEMKSGLKFAAEKSAFSGRHYENVIGDHDDYNAAPVLALLGDIKEQFWFGADYYSSTLGDTMHSGAWLVWDKRLDESADKMYGSCFELVWSKQKHKRDILRHKWAGVFGVEQEPEKMRFHPNQKPTPLIRDILERYSDIGAIAIDCYCGSGTTLVACEQTGRIGYGMEISPEYCAVILQRLKDMGLSPERASE